MSDRRRVDLRTLYRRENAVDILITFIILINLYAIYIACRGVVSFRRAKK